MQAAVLTRSKEDMANAEPAPTSGANPTEFVNLIDSLLPEVIRLRGSRDYALNRGVDEKALERYATGACSLYEREEIESVIAKNKWSRDYVVQYVKSRR